MPTLSSEQLSILHNHAQAGDRIAYYTALSSFGFPYGSLALGVVLNDTVSGAAANSFFVDQASNEGVSISGNQLADISLNLMLADLAARTANAGADLSLDQIKAYHEQVFNDVASVSINAWTPNLYLMSFTDPAERQMAWDNMLSEFNTTTFARILLRLVELTNEYLDNHPEVNAGITFDLLYVMNREQMLEFGIDAAFADWFLSYKLYTVDLQYAGLDGTVFEPSNHYGPFDLALSNGGHMIGGNETDESLSGTVGNDVLIGFDGDDTFASSGGSDRYHGGPGIDVVDYTHHQTAITLQLGALQTGAPQWAPIRSEGHDVQAVNHGGEGELRDYLVDIDSVLGSEQGDTVEIFGSLEEIEAASALTYFSVYGGANLDTGDTVDLSGVTGGPVAVVMGDVNGGDILVSRGGLSGPWFGAYQFENVVGTFGSDTVAGNSFRNTVFGADGSDTIDGGAGHDDLHGGFGNDTLAGGDGADFLLDNGAAAPQREDEDDAAYQQRLQGYDSLGNDVLFGGAGADVLLHSGGQDIFFGGAGDDVYLVAQRAAKSTAGTDNLTIVLSENAGDPTSFIGHDLITGSGSGIDRVVFQGINLSDVSFRYDYQAVLSSTTISDFNPLFPWTLDPSRTEIAHFLTFGALEIVINATGSSLTIEQVFGTQSQLVRGISGAQPEAQIDVPFVIEFADGLLDWAEVLLNWSGGANGHSFVKTPVSGSAFAARDALAAERAVADSTQTGGAGNDDLYGSNSSDLIIGGAGDDRIRTGAGSDVLIGGAGADTLDGGSGRDAASYATASAAVTAVLDPSRFATLPRQGDAVGDQYVSIEDLVGSAFDDELYGDAGANLIDGGAGADTIHGLGHFDTLLGGDGDDYIAASEFINAGVVYIADADMYGGNGNDTIWSSSGNDKIFGGEGDDSIGLSYHFNVYTPGTPGNDTVDGGAGTDQVHFGYTSAVSVDLAAGRAHFLSTGETATLRSIENVVGSVKSDLIIGSDDNNRLSGEAGNDTLVGGLGNDTLEGASSTVGSEANALYGGIGIDTAVIFADRSSASFSYVEGGIVITVGNTTHTVYDDVEFIRFNDQTATYQSIAAGLQTAFGVIDDYIRVGEGGTQDIAPFENDLPYQGSPLLLLRLNGVAVSPGSVIRLSSGATLTVLADGSLRFDQAGAYAWLGAGDVVMESVTYTATDVTGVERSADLTIIVDGAASPGDQIHLSVPVVFGDTDPLQATARRIANFDIGRGVVVIDGILVDPNAPPAGVTLEEIDGDTYVLFGDDAIILSDISLAAWQFRSAQGQAGGSGNEALNGTAAAELLMGNGGNDTLRGNGGYDVLAGGTGNDSIYLGDQGGVILGDEGSDRLYGGDGIDHLYAGNGNDSAYAGSGNDLVYGGDGNDYLAGYGGNDTIFGGAGNDTIGGGTGTGLGVGENPTGGLDVLDGGSGFDIVALQTEMVNGASVGAYVDLVSGWIFRSAGLPSQQIIGFEGAFGSGTSDTLLGNDGANRLDGVGGNDTLWGGAGNDTITDGYGDESIDGGDGDDYIQDTAGNDRIFGGAGNDTIYDTVGDDSLFGGAGNDILRSYVGADLIDGGDGIDTIDLSFGNSLLLVDIDLDVGIIPGNTPDTLVNIENATGSQGNNRLTGNTGANVLDGQDGSDTLLGRGGDDRLLGGAGDDTLDGGLGADTLQGGVGNDTFVVDDIGDLVVELSGEGVDVVQSSISYTLAMTTENLVLLVGGLTGTGSAYTNQITGSSGADTLLGMDGQDTLFGGTGDDLLDGGTGNDFLTGGSGNDFYIADSGTDSVTELAGGGEDTVASSATYTLSNEVEHLILSGALAINGTGNALANTITGNAAANVLNGGSGDDTLLGGDGNDSYMVDTLGDLVSELAGQGADTVTASVNYTLMENVEALILSGSAGISGTGNSDANSLTGNAGANLLQGLAGDDSLFGGNGDDTLDGGIGNDSFQGGNGNDVYFVDAAGDIVTEFSYGGLDTVRSTVSHTLALQVENLVLLGSAAINGTGNSLSNYFIGNIAANVISGLDGLDYLDGDSGNDTLDGGTGNDTLNGGTGADSMIGGSGDDLFIVDATADIVNEASGGGTDGVESSVSYTLSGNVENLTLKGDQAFDGTGNTLANLLTGNDNANNLRGLDGSDSLFGGIGNDTLDGGIGNDSLSGGLGDDSMNGGTGNDTYVVDSSGDVIIEAASAGTDLVQSAVTFILGANLENLTLTGTSALQGTGNTLNNLLTGNTGANTLAGLSGNDSLYGAGDHDILDGGDGNDLLDGGTGNDTLVGGAGNDTYVVDNADDLVIDGGGGTDLVQSAVSYVLAADLENLSLTGAAAINGTGTNSANTLSGNSGANLLTALAGNDSLYGGSGNDTLWGGDDSDYLDGGTGADSMEGGAGNDIYIVDSSGDVLLEAADAGVDTVNSSLSYTLGADLENLTLTGSTAINATGNAAANDLVGNTGANVLTALDGNDRLYGGSGNDMLLGGAGNDTLDGGAGTDNMDGGEGDDLYVVDSASDIVGEAVTGGTDLVQSSVTFTLGVGIENLVLTGTAALSGTGNSLSNALTGNTGANTLNGLDGDDTLSGGSGNDTLLGGAGRDRLDGGAGVDSMSGGLGDDLYVVDATTDLVVEGIGEGFDEVTASVTWTLAANLENLTLLGTGALAGTGNAAANVLTGNSGANTLSGLDGDDMLIGGAGNDSLTGGLGLDSFVFRATSDGVDVITDFNELNGGGEEGDVLRFEGLGVGAFAYLGTGAFSGGGDNAEARVAGNQVLVDANGDGVADLTITLIGLTSAAQLSESDFLFT